MSPFPCPKKSPKNRANSSIQLGARRLFHGPETGRHSQARGFGIAEAHLRSMWEGFSWDFHGDLVGFSWDFDGDLMGFSWDFDGISRDFHGMYLYIIPIW